MTRTKNTSIELLGTITSAEISNANRLVLTIDVCQPEMVIFSIRLDSTAGQNILARVCRFARLNSLVSAEHLVGKRIPVRVVQPAVEEGMVTPLVCLEVCKTC